MEILDYQLRLLSVAEAAKALGVGKDTMYNLVSIGRIGYIQIGKRKKISYPELLRFQNDNTIKAMPHEKINEGLLSSKDIERMFNLDSVKQSSLNGNEILQKIMEG
jgi:excisionase family DNA binding protein